MSGCAHMNPRDACASCWREKWNATMDREARWIEKLTQAEAALAAEREAHVTTADDALAARDELRTEREKSERLRAALDRVLTEAGMQAHKHGCPERMRRPARWDEFAPCAGCQAEAALAAAKGGE